MAGLSGGCLSVEVFLVEDLKNIQSAMAQMLQGLGDFHIAAAVSTEAEALGWLEQNPRAWDLAVIDLVLEQGSGIGVISRARRTAPDARVVIFSNFVTPGIKAHCLRLGADAAFDKNAELSDFADYCADLAASERAAPAA
jgi:DNA-binding NarL/FixJ family response regulator